MRVTLSQLKNSLVLSIGFLATTEAVCIPAHQNSAQRANPSLTTTDRDSSSLFAIENAARSILADAKSQISRLINSAHAEAVAEYKPMHRVSHKSHISSKQTVDEGEDEAESTLFISNLKFHSAHERTAEFVHNVEFGKANDAQAVEDIADSLVFAQGSKNFDHTAHDLRFNLRK